ncbi:MAG: fibronectin type III domain-containing protein [Eubacterium sp.]|nr:fibronectin type III domain-containing protein [Eubacterium sp.]
MKKIKRSLCILVVLCIIGVFSTKVEALSPPYLSLNTSQDVITKDNAILHASLYNIGVQIKGFEMRVYKDSELIKSGFKAVEYNKNDNKINIVFDLKKDLSIVLLPETKYYYSISAKADVGLNEEMYKQSFWFTTTKFDSDITEPTTTQEETTTKDRIQTKTRKPGPAKIKSVRYVKKKFIVIKFKKVKNAKKYQIQYATNKRFKKFTIKTTRKLKYTIKKLKKGKTYYIRVRGINETKKGSWSQKRKVTIK